MLAPLGQTSITHCSFDGEGFDDFAWIVARGRTRVVGAIGALNCTFFRCRMTQIGLAIPEDEAERVRQSFEG